ncbi:MAG: hypothetical protein FJX72_16855 [Armatimonadetes bacterium]|nr:hypothetical protein [Armatimonadota bacterium]
MTSEPEALAAQTRYLTQFMAHVNPYTGLSYAADPAIVAVEPINEPVYPAGLTDARVTDYINALAEAIRRSGCRKPILYNGWERRHAAVRDADVDGCTFNWYPTGLVNGHSLRWNVLPTLDRHPDMHDTVLDGKAKAVYEFDPADVPASCVYPAMARSFRAGGAQLAAQFQYDPVLSAGTNLSWQTHHLNLCYTPAKAISLMIAAEAFRRIPRGGNWGAYPGNRRFGAFEVSFERDLSQMNAPDRFYHSATTNTHPRNAAALRHVAGCGFSPLVRYGGSGAYFLDRVEAGMWRLEVYPDAVPAHDPYGRPYVGREVARLVHRDRRMEIRLPDLGTGFRVVSDSGTGPISARDGAFTVRPGGYLLVRDSVRRAPSVPQPTACIPAGNDSPDAWHDPPRQWVAGRPMPIEVRVVGADEPLRVDLICGPEGSGRTAVRRMRPVGACRYAVTIPGPMMKEGLFRYGVRATGASGARAYPSGLSWGADASARDLFVVSGQMRVEPYANFGGPPDRRAKVVPGPDEGDVAIRIEADGPLPRRAFGRGGLTDACIGLGHMTPANRSAFRGAAVAVCVRSIADTTAVQVGLSEPDGTSFAADVPVTSSWREVLVPLHEFAAVDRRGLGRTIGTIGGIWFSLLGRLTRSDGPQSVDVASARLRPHATAWEVPVVRRDAPLLLYVASRDNVWTGNPVSHVHYPVSGMDGRAPAYRLAARDLGLVVGFRRDCTDATLPRLADLDGLRHVRVRARWKEPRTCPVQVALIEHDGVPGQVKEHQMWSRE